MKSRIMKSAAAALLLACICLTPVHTSGPERQAGDLVNSIRIDYGLEPLEFDEDLSDLARFKAQDMARQGYFSHQSPTYGSPFQMMKAFGLTYRSAGENIAMGYRSAQAVVNAWMASASHRANLLSTRYDTLGVGYYNGYWAQWFLG